ncbi:hypothetical protein SAMN05421805_103264 [Saccharopolyspora antimicrobica]|uniref:Uncharacterized protein n=1 Tax=Saccharopolyspora antimicrobica TaxID=455193 RepID=A0A1I4X5N8_9PSEU|nr:hypothetical protein ATL45_2648 [Saccharopolyspora antimicrobica]SFN21318.1 hypothetical protein SAMN05421805_103264 [Saccharopolyspora antimicrobica]
MAAGGSLPDLGSTVVITVLLAGAGVALADRKRGSWGILGALGVSQLSLHVFLQLVASHQDGPGAIGMPFSPLAMTLGHLGAVLVTGLLMARAERALFVVARLLRSILPRRPRPLPTVTETPTVCVPAITVRPLAHLLYQRIHARRGPPESPAHDQVEFAA